MSIIGPGWNRIGAVYGLGVAVILLALAGLSVAFFLGIFGALVASFSGALAPAAAAFAATIATLYVWALLAGGGLILVGAAVGLIVVVIDALLNFVPNAIATGPAAAVVQIGTDIAVNAGRFVRTAADTVRDGVLGAIEVGRGLIGRLFG